MHRIVRYVAIAIIGFWCIDNSIAMKPDLFTQRRQKVEAIMRGLNSNGITSYVKKYVHFQEIKSTDTAKIIMAAMALNEDFYKAVSSIHQSRVPNYSLLRYYAEYFVSYVGELAENLKKSFQDLPSQALTELVRRIITNEDFIGLEQYYPEAQILINEQNIFNLAVLGIIYNHEELNRSSSSEFSESVAATNLSCSDSQEYQGFITSCN